MAKPGYIHERAVAMLKASFEGAYHQGQSFLRDSGVDKQGNPLRVLRVRLKDGQFSGDISRGVSKVVLPDEWTNIGGVVPDLICYGEDGKPVRIIEVVVTNPPNRYKCEKLRLLEKRGVDVVEVYVRTEVDLRRLFPSPAPRKWARKQRSGFHQDEPVLSFVRALQIASPYARREFYATLKEISALDSLWPVSEEQEAR